MPLRLSAFRSQSEQLVTTVTGVAEKFIGQYFDNQDNKSELAQGKRRFGFGSRDDFLRLAEILTFSEIYGKQLEGGRKKYGNPKTGRRLEESRRRIQCFATLLSSTTKRIRIFESLN